jgi:hypothetical protein
VWIPESAAALEAAISEGGLEETPSQDFKEALPAKKSNVDLALDVCAMTVDGGVLVYGVGEDENKRPTRLAPFELPGAAERVDQIIQSSIHEIPEYRVVPLPLAGDTSRGYLLVVVPSSARAPHQLVAAGKAQYRYYGRGATGNRVLTEPEIARLYRRREDWAVDRQFLLDGLIEKAPFEPSSDHGFLHAFARPVAVDDTRWTEAAGNNPAGLQNEMLAAAQRANQGLGYDPALAAAAVWKRHGADTWQLGREDFDDPAHSVRCEIDFDGHGRLFCGRAADRRGPSAHAPDQPGHLLLIEQIVAGNLGSFFALMGAFYDACHYVGPVDIGIALTGIRDAHGMVVARGFVTGPGYPQSEYRTDLRTDAGELQRPRELTRRTLARFFEALVQPGFDPFDA